MESVIGGCGKDARPQRKLSSSKPRPRLTRGNMLYNIVCGTDYYDDFLWR
jgi:hypothetical protein